MSIGAINTNIASIIVSNYLHLSGKGLQTSLERLSSGVRINRGADDPSGLSISKIMEVEIRGIRTATQNTEDDISLIHTSDGALAETHDILMRMRDLAVRASNGAEWTAAQMSTMNVEFQALMSELTRKAQAITFNTKFLHEGAFSNQAMQVGQNNPGQYQIALSINAMTAAEADGIAGAGLSIQSLLLWSLSAAISEGVAYAESAIEGIQSAIDYVSNTRNYLGIQEQRLRHIINDLKTQDINISETKSRIWDADMAVEIAEFTKLQILQQSATAILAQANKQPQSVLQLISNQL